MKVQGRFKRFTALVLLAAMSLGVFSCESEKESKSDLKFYLFENDFFAANEIYELDECQYAVRDGMLSIRYSDDERNEFRNESGLQYHDSYTLIDLTSGETSINKIYHGEEYTSAGLDSESTKKVDVALTSEGGELILFFESQFVSVSGDSSEVKYVATGSKSQYKVRGWTKDKYSKRWSFDGDNEAFEGAFVEIPQMVSDDDGNLVLYFPTGKSCFIVSDYGSTIRRVDVPESDSELKTDLCLRDGKALLCRSYSGDYRHIIWELDGTAGKFGEGVEIIANPSSSQYTMLNGYKIGYRGSDGLYGVDDNGTELIFSWMDIGLTGNMVEELYPIDRDSYFVIYRDSITNKLHDGLIKRAEESEYLEFMSAKSKVETDELTNVKKLKLVVGEMTSFSNGISSAVEYIQRFNRENADIQVEMESVSSSEELMKRMLSGNVPDVIMFGSTLKSSDFTEQNMFIDLYDFMDSDEAHSRDSFLPCVLEPFEEKDGSLKLLTTDFTMSALAGSSDTLGSLTEWTYEEMLSYAENLDSGTALAYFGVPTGTDHSVGFLQRIMYPLLGEFINEDDKICSFDDGRFARLLEICKNSTFVTSNTNIVDLKGFYNGDIALSFASLDGVYGYMISTGCVFFERDPVLIGYPRAEGDSGVVITPKTQFAITSSCEDTEAAWSLIGYFTDTQYEVWDTFIENNREFKDQATFPCTKAAAERMFDVAKDMYALLTICEVRKGDGQVVRTRSEGGGYKYKGTDENGDPILVEFADPVVRGNYAASVAGKEGEGIATYAEFDDSDAELLMKLFNECKTVYGTNGSAVSIIVEEAEAYFSGAKALDEVVKLIQDRVTTQINE